MSMMYKIAVIINDLLKILKNMLFSDEFVEYLATAVVCLLFLDLKDSSKFFH